MSLPLRISAWKFGNYLLLALNVVKLNSSSAFFEQILASVVESTANLCNQANEFGDRYNINFETVTNLILAISSNDK